MPEMVVLWKEFPGLEVLEREAPDWRVIVTDDAALAREHIARAEILATWSAELVRACLSSETIRWIQFFAAGVDSLPLERLRERSVFLTNASGVHAQPICETMFAMILALARGLRNAILDQRERAWGKSRGNADSLTEIHAKTLGILGLGAIGVETARVGQAFGMRVLGLRRGGADAPHVERVYAPEQAEAMLAECDYVMNLLPLTDETRGFMNAARFAAMKPGACYVSAGRGATTDQGALIAALERGHLGGAGLDVTDPEPLPADSPLWTMRNVIVTPHIAGQTDRYAGRMAQILLENFRAYVRAGRPTRNLVDYERQY